MPTYPSVNWWPNNVRPYESELSFLARFCALNCIPPRTCFDFLKMESWSYFPPSEGDIARVSSLLREDRARLLQLFQHAVDLQECGSYAPPREREKGWSVRYCPACVRHGYHSYLHEVSWLSKCPIHMTDLIRVSAIGSGKMAARRVLTLKRLMQEHCASWPDYARDGFPTREPGALQVLASWVRDACEAAQKMKRGERWRSGESTHLGHLSMAQAIGQLRALAPMPTEIEPLFTECGGTWVAHREHFSSVAKRELERLNARGLSFDSLFRFYKDTGETSDGSPAWYCKTVQQGIKERHGTCRCQWEHVKGPFSEFYWVKVVAEELGPLSFQCPFEVALTELELDWGRRGRALSARLAQRDMYRFLEKSRAMRDAGVLSYKAGASLSPDGYLYAMQDVWPCCEWDQDSPLLDLFRTAARWEIECAHSAITRWLDNIDQGIEPFRRDDPLYCVRLYDDDDGLSLVRWSKVHA